MLDTQAVIRSHLILYPTLNMSSDKKPHISPNSFLHAFSTAPSEPSEAPLIVYFITGNPGLIGYYHTFLSLLSEKTKSSFIGQDKERSFQIYGHSLAGFELPEPEQKEQKPESEPHYYDLEEQIRFAQSKIHDFAVDRTNGIDHLSPPSDTAPPTRPKVILIGHSVGAYIAMEVLRRHREGSKSDFPVDFDVIGGAMLFPTIVDIAKSPSGQKLTKLLSIIPQLALVAGIFVRILTALVPASILRSLIRIYMPSAPDTMVDTTAGFLKSKRGVQQALHMAADEMQTITMDKWSDDVWGISTSQEPTSRLFFYFGRNDHWVAERTRDEIIEVRGQVPGGPKMIVCEDGVPHAFCLRHSDFMASKVADIIMDIARD
ncbi:hypothetical protein P170DRAFT_1451 [Aspergillus steynii IBT 23096]|uniref:Alpha/beta-hydrolase n=1 Tax=Aspergillus steynii IBT 23096 TaxID=1392250 RepID=A0A2I2GLB5_9EURO|nr:uncharacterized protein P170DRAFT_1451 [Aspergillus steynii IBT 23096]PLB53649.1 hypothetical protein P170DRAFT_1451 [Aspergillus steynii IBT 23096]